MIYKFLLIFLIFVFSCTQKNENITFESVQNYSNIGFTLVYSDEMYKSKKISNKLDERSLIVFNYKIKSDTPVKITNLLNNKYLIAKTGKKSKYPFFYNSVVSKRIADELELNMDQPYIQIKTLDSNSIFIANKSKTFEEEREVADKAPVEGILIKNIGTDLKQKKLKKKTKSTSFNYIIKFADLFFDDSAQMLKKRLADEFDIKNVKVKKISQNSYRVYSGPFMDLDSLKKEFINLNKLNFENLEIIKL